MLLTHFKPVFHLSIRRKHQKTSFLMFLSFSGDIEIEHRLKPINYQCCSHIETSQLIYTVNQLTGFYMRATLALNGLKWLKLLSLYISKTIGRQVPSSQGISIRIA